MNWDEKVKKFGEPKPNKIYNCKVKSFTTGKIVDTVLKCVNEDDVVWRTADDNSELDEWNWDVIEWVLRT